MDSLQTTLHTKKFTSSQNVLYHEIASKFFGRVIDTTTFLSIVFASAVIASWAELSFFSEYINEFLSLVPAVLLTLVNSYILVWRVSDKRAFHAAKRKEWVAILGEIDQLELIGDLDTVKSDVRRVSKLYFDTLKDEGEIHHRWSTIDFAETSVRLDLAEEALESPPVQNCPAAMRILSRGIEKKAA